jgi:hypothetical protein
MRPGCVPSFFARLLMSLRQRTVPIHEQLLHQHNAADNLGEFLKVVLDHRDS